MRDDEGRAAGSYFSQWGTRGRLGRRPFCSPRLGARSDKPCIRRNMRWLQGVMHGPHNPQPSPIQHGCQRGTACLHPAPPPMTGPLPRPALSLAAACLPRHRRSASKARCPAWRA